MSDLNDSLDDLLGSPSRIPYSPPASYVAPNYSEPCKKCRGSGRFFSYAGRDCGPCFACKAKGTMIYKTSHHVRADNRASAANRKTANREADIAAFNARNPEIAAWLAECRDFDFAESMRQALAQYGDLTVNQIAACNRCIVGRNKARADRTSRELTAPTIDVLAIEAAFAKASSSLRAPQLHLDSFTIKHASATGKNAGALYVTESGEYLGKIVAGKFLAVRSCGDSREAKVIAAAVDPAAATVRYGRLTGRCGCCNRPLTNAESVARGIGPICAERYGF